jgi:cobalt-precorrin 5A hydrolase
VTPAPSDPPSSNAGKRFVIGMGCESGASAVDLLALAARALQEAGIEPHRLTALASIDSKIDEPAILAVAAHYAVPTQFFDAPTLERETPRLQNPSDLVFARVGCHGVAEAAALAAAGPGGLLVLPKLKSTFATVAIARIV